MNLHEVLNSSKKLYMVMDLVLGGELFEAIAAEGRLPENTARGYFQQLIDGIAYCHSRRVYHRDLKPENLLLTGDKKTLKITDFGLASIKNHNTDTELLHTIMGSPHYIAPEIITSADKGYEGEKVDIWASGVILYGILAGCLPFDAPSTKDLYYAIVHQPITFPKHFSYDVIKLLRAMLHKDPSRRASIDEIKTYPWFKVNYEPAVTFPEGEFMANASVRTASLMTDIDNPSTEKRGTRPGNKVSPKSDSAENERQENADQESLKQFEETRSQNSSNVKQRKSVLALKEMRSRTTDRSSNTDIFTLSDSKSPVTMNSKTIGEKLGALITGHGKRTNLLDIGAVTPRKSNRKNDAALATSPKQANEDANHEDDQVRSPPRGVTVREEDATAENRANPGATKSHFHLRMRRPKNLANPMTPKAGSNPNIFGGNEKDHNLALYPPRSTEDNEYDNPVPLERTSPETLALSPVSDQRCSAQQEILQSPNVFQATNSARRLSMPQTKCDDRSLKLHPSIFTDRSQSKQSEEDTDIKQGCNLFSAKYGDQQQRSGGSRQSSFNRSESHSLAEHKMFRSRSCSGNRSGEELHRTVSDLGVLQQVIPRSIEGLSKLARADLEDGTSTNDHQAFQGFRSCSENSSADSDRCDNQDEVGGIVDNSHLFNKKGSKSLGSRLVLNENNLTKPKLFKAYSNLATAHAGNSVQDISDGERQSGNDDETMSIEPMAQETQKASVQEHYSSTECSPRSDMSEIHGDDIPVQKTLQEGANTLKRTCESKNFNFESESRNNLSQSQGSEMPDIFSPLSPEANEQNFGSSCNNQRGSSGKSSQTKSSWKSPHNNHFQNQISSIENHSQTAYTENGTVGKNRLEVHSEPVSSPLMPEYIPSPADGEVHEETDNVAPNEESYELIRQQLIEAIRKEDHDNGYPPWNALGIDVFEDCDESLLTDKIHQGSKQAEIYEKLRQSFPTDLHPERADSANVMKEPKVTEIFAPLDSKVLRTLSSCHM